MGKILFWSSSVRLVNKMRLTCIICPLGCTLDLEVENKEIKKITGNGCKRGISFAQTEFHNPQRMVTTIVSLEGGEYPFLPVISEGEVPKKDLKECMDFLQKVKVKAPIKMGDIVAKNIVGTGVNIIAAKTARMEEM